MSIYIVIGVILVACGFACIAIWIRNEIINAIRNYKNEIEVEIVKSEVRLTTKLIGRAEE